MGSIIKYKGKVPQVGERVFIAEGACLVGDVSIGDDSSVFYNAVLRASDLRALSESGGRAEDQAYAA